MIIADYSDRIEPISREEKRQLLNETLSDGKQGTANSKFRT